MELKLSLCYTYFDIKDLNLPNRLCRLHVMPNTSIVNHLTYFEPTFALDQE